jgi:hypothetical protein
MTPWIATLITRSFRMLPAVPAAALLCLTPGGLGAPLPTIPPEGLRLSFSLSCDFETQWWEAVFYPEDGDTLTVRWLTPSLFSDEPQQRPRALSVPQQQALYAHGRDLLNAASLSWEDDALDTEGPWLGHRTFTVSAQRLDHRLGRVDRLDYNLDLHPGRPLPAALEALAAILKTIDRRLRFSLDCR